MRKIITIGVTGPIGAGKSTAAKIFGSFGAGVIDADQLGRQVLAEDPGVKRRLVANFGKIILDKEGAVDRAALARLAFQTAGGKVNLDKTTHPALLKQIRMERKALAKRCSVVIIDAALLPQWKLIEECDVVITVLATGRAKKQRLAARGMAAGDMTRRMKSQLTDSEYSRRADIVIENNGTKRELRSALKLIWQTVVLRMVDSRRN